jgi:hypothetical protein
MKEEKNLEKSAFPLFLEVEIRKIKDAQSGHQNLHPGGMTMKDEEILEKGAFPLFLERIEISDDLQKIADQLTATELQINAKLQNEASLHQPHHVKEAKVLKKKLIDVLLPLLDVEVPRLSDGRVRHVVLARLNESRRLGCEKTMLHESQEIKIDPEHRQYQSQKRTSQAHL